MPARRAYLSLTLIRCGRTPWEEAGRLQGRTNLPLSDTGRAEVEAILPYLRGASFRSVQHPPDDAASETARLAGRACSAKAREAADLVEPDLGLWEGLADQQFAERYPKRLKQWQDDPMSLIPPEGEPFAEARDLSLIHI